MSQGLRDKPTRQTCGTIIYYKFNFLFMSTHTVYGTAAYFKEGAEKVKDLFQHEKHRHEFERHVEEAEKHGKAKFSLGGTEFKVKIEEKDGKSIPVFERHH